MDPAALQDLDARLSLVMDLARKHRIDPGALPAHLEALSTELEGISTDRSALAALRESAADLASSPEIQLQTELGPLDVLPDIPGVEPWPAG